ncbi:MAG: VOC family protein [Bacteroidia bacterium]
MLQLKRIHHIAIICSNYNASRLFYTEVLGLTVLKETYRKERDSYKLDLSLNGQYCIELFSFSNPPARLTRPEATGLRHLAFEVDDIKMAVTQLNEKNVIAETIRTDEFTGKQFTFIFDPDNLPIELYQK